MRTTPKMGLTSWDQEDDAYNHAQLAGNWQSIDYHDHSPGRGVPVVGIAPGAVLGQSIAAGVVGPQHLSTALVQDLGINGSGNTGRGYWSKAAVDTTTSAAFTSLGDVVNGIVVTTGGYIEVGYHALWSVSAGTGQADVFLNGTEITNGTKANASGSTPASTTATFLSPLYTSPGVLSTTASTTANSSEVTTGETVGGVLRAFVNPGTYNVGVEFNVTGGTLTVQNRHLWAIAFNFG